MTLGELEGELKKLREEHGAKSDDVIFMASDEEWNGLYHISCVSMAAGRIILSPNQYTNQTFSLSEE